MIAELFDIWLRGYCSARGLGNPELVPGGFWLEVAKPQQAGRYFVNRYDPGILSRIICETDEPAVYIEFPGTKEQASQLVPQGWHIREDAYLMSVALVTQRERKLCNPAGFKFAVSTSDIATKIEVRTVEGLLAGRGCFASLGDWAVFDQILIEPEFRRQGLGFSLVDRLINEAAATGSVDAVLVATEEGRALYNRVGWTEVSTIVSIISP